MSDQQKTKTQAAMDAAGFVVPAPLVVWAFAALGVPVDPATAAAIGTALTYLGFLVVRRVRAALES